MKVEWRSVVLISVVLLLVALPFLLAIGIAGQGVVFNGFLYNPLDGNSYLSKMVEGARGDWKFTLPYTAEPGQGAYLFLFYILLGKLAALLSLPNILVFHFARILCALYLLLELRKFCQALFPDDKNLAWKAFLVAALFSGMGWLAVGIGRLSADLVVPEAYTFLSSFTNPHFPLSLALILFTLRKILLEDEKPFQPTFLLIGFVLANLSPFSVVVTLVIIGVVKLWLMIQEKKMLVWNILFFLLGAIPVLFYQYFIIKIDPILAEWNTQNLTPAPAIIDLLIAFLPGLIFAVMGIIFRLRSKTTRATRLLVVWTLAGFILTYLPFNLQRRFMIGLTIPFAALVVIGIQELKSIKWRNICTILLFALMIPTNLVIIVLGLTSVAQHSPDLTYTTDEASAFSWIQSYTQSSDIILAAPETGNLIPAITGRRVVYGHPFETAFASEKKQNLTDFFSGNMDTLQMIRYIEDENIHYIFWGSQEMALGHPRFLDQLPVAFSSGQVEIFSLNSNP
jgi:hypothetical protein